MKNITLAAALFSASLVAVSTVEAATVPAAAVEYASVFEDVGFVSGYDAFSEEISLSGGNYRLTLTDFDFSDRFAKLAVMLSTATDRLYSIKMPTVAANNGDQFWQQSIDFTLAAGQYYLSFFGKNTGQLSFYGISLDQKLDQPAPVPVPAAFLLFGSGLLALAGAVRRRNA